MPCHTRMKLLLRGLLWLFILDFSFMVTSLEPGFLDFDNLPDTNFSCVGKVIGGYYADLETSCQMFHVCTIGQLDEPMDIRFLCLNGTVFDQETRVCERIDEVDCSKSEQFYSLNLELYGNTQPPILEESSETELPELNLPKRPTTTTTTTTARPTPSKTPRQNFIITTSKSTTTTVAVRTPLPQPTQRVIVPQPVQHVQAQIPQPPKPPQPQPQLHFVGSRPEHSDAAPDIRFNPEEYKISLSSGGPPNIRTNVNVNVNVNPNSANNPHHVGGEGKPISFQTFSDNNKRVIVTTHTTVYKSEKQPLHVVTSASAPAPAPMPLPTKQDVLDQEDYDAELSDSTEDSYSYGYRSQQHQPETLKLTYQSQTEALPKTYQYRPGFRPSQALEDYKPSTFRSVFHPATNNPLKINYNHRGGGPTTYRNHYGYFNQGPLVKTEKQPTLPPLTFSSPAPFSLNRHVETKRFIDHRILQQQVNPQLQHQQHQRHQQQRPPHQLQHQQQSQQASQQQLVHHHQPPRIVISASASVSDASGRKFNYSLGTIGDTRFFGNAPQSYDDYKEDDVGSDPFYHDVPKIRLKRQAPQLPPEQPQQPQSNVEEAGEKEAIDVLKFLFSWYNNHEKDLPTQQSGSNLGNIPIKSETITEINDALTPKYSANQHPEHGHQQHQEDRDFLYEDFDVDQKQLQPQFVGVPQRNDFERPYLSLQLLKPPFEQDPINQVNPEVLKQRNERVNPGLEQQKVENHDFESQKHIVVPTTTATSISTPRSRVEHHTQPPKPIKTHQVQAEHNYYDYVDDNYEPLTYQEDTKQKQLNVKQQALADYQQFKESFVQNYQNYPEPQQNTNNVNRNTKENGLTANYKTVGNYKETEQNYSLPDYVDDNYEPVVYQEQKKVDKVTTTPETLTTLQQQPVFGVNNNENKQSGDIEPSYYYDRYNHNLDLKTNLKDNVDLTGKSEITSKVMYGPSDYDLKVSRDDYKDLADSQFSDKDQNSRYVKSTTIEPSTGVTENYQQVLGILGITTRKPVVTNDQSVPSVAAQDKGISQKSRHQGRGKTRFSLKDVADVPDDVIYGRKQTKPKNTVHSSHTTKTLLITTTPTVPIEESLPEDTLLEDSLPSLQTTLPPSQAVVVTEVPREITTQNLEYTINVNRRTEDMAGFVDTGYSSVSTLPTVQNVPSSTESYIIRTSPIKDLGSDKILETSLVGDGKKLMREQDLVPTTMPSTTFYTTERYTTIYLQKLIENVEETTGSVVGTPNKQDIGQNQEQVKVIDAEDLKTTTVAVPTTLLANLYDNYDNDTQDEVRSSTQTADFSKDIINFEVTTGGFTDKLQETVIFGSQDDISVGTVPSTTILTTTTPVATITDPVTQSSTSSTTSTTTASPYTFVSRNSGRKDSNNYRRRSKSRFRVNAPTTTTTTSTTTPVTLVKNDTTEFETEFPSLVAYATSTIPTVTISSTLPTLPTIPTVETVPTLPTAPDLSISSNLPTLSTLTTTLSPHITNKPYLTLNEEIIGAIKNKMSAQSRKIEFNINAYTANLAYRIKTTPLTLLPHPINPSRDILKETNQNIQNKDSIDVVAATDPPIARSAQPTLSNVHLRRVSRLPTTPISQSTAINVRKQVKNRKYTFNCVDKKVNQFYSDPRDCRLFHYCTRGFTRTQYLDMKFVCDLGTFFDDTRLVCTEVKPSRCA